MKTKFPQLFMFFIVSSFLACREEEQIEPQIPGDAIGVISSSPATIYKNLITLSGAKNISSLGIKGDGKTDVTEKVQVALNTYQNLYFPKGTYIITKPLKLRSNQAIDGADGTIFKTTKTFLTKTKDHFYFFFAEGKKNIKISDLAFIGFGDVLKDEAAVYLLRSDNVTITNLNAKYCSLARLSAGDNITIDKSVGYGKKVKMWGDEGISIAWSSNWTIKNTVLEHYYQGIQWWGGDSHPDKDGAVSNERKCKNGLVENVTVDDIRNGGIWGSMGDNITIKNCKISNCGDIGIDFEGCTNSRAENNVIKNCKNGCLATFYYTKNIKFVNNTVSQSNKSYPLARIYGFTNNQSNGTITFDKNRFTSSGGFGFINQFGPSNKIIFKNNELNDVILNLSCKFNKEIYITNNTFNIKSKINNYNNIIKAGYTRNNGLVEIVNNRINSAVKQDPSVFAIHTYQDDNSSIPTNRLVNNNFAGIKWHYRIESRGKANTKTKTYIQSSLPVSASNLKTWTNPGAENRVYINDVLKK